MATSYEFEVAPGVVCIQPPCPTCLGECGKLVPLDPTDPDSDEEWEPCLACDATGLHPFTGWPPPPEWCQPARTAAPLGGLRRLVYRLLPWGPE